MSKDFTIKHMNADHRESLQVYLQAFCAISAREARHARLEDLELSHLIVSANGTRYSIPIDPPMKDFNEARGRLVALRKDSLQRLGRSDITITEYRAPRGPQKVIFGLCVFLYITCFRRSNLLPGSFVYENMGYKLVPDFAHFVYNIQPWLFPGVIVCHILEATGLAIWRLKPHGVPALSGLWWAWIGSCLLEGFGTWARTKDIITEARAKQGGKSE
ncbi:hypothetical protein N7492_000950 [Penicillium capsulatum]|uniref:DUF2470 domain-containing protein n=1 Tax=Penicillium capsulatum TaxID=69766 RepID=A0A9W9ISS9_9EURO|nr:hypothetical protein N7492_000950 [Penicillium capsulatum]KAJ6129994.1 hypothetical protein N7512_002774 [Penicillium capsulatum]